MRAFAVALGLIMALGTGTALAQHRDGPHKGGPAKTAGGGERRGIEQRGDPRRPERMSPEDRERPRRDIDDANRRMERRR